MILSKSCIYGLRASVLLASKKNDEYTNIQELSDELDISFHFLTKVLQLLTQSEILESYKGPNGGVRLARNANSITFIDIITAIDKHHSLSECILGLPGCGELKPCPMHDQWSHLKENLMNMMEHTTLHELAERKENHQFRSETNTKKNF